MRRRIEAWAVDRPDIGVKVFALKEDAAEWLGSNEGSLLRLVPYDPKAQRIFRAAVRWYHNGRLLNDLDKAVRRLLISRKNERKRRAKR